MDLYLEEAEKHGLKITHIIETHLHADFASSHRELAAQDNTVKLGERVWQIERTPWRGTLAGCRVLISEHLDGRVTISYGPHVVGRYSAQGLPLAGQPRTVPARRRGGPWALTSVALRAPSVSTHRARA